ncbi:hypothetical protein [Streptomyces sp. NPDC006459]|uniref:hypothetical protein n=1 Tax=Streptomyces sp. NPDC006459 TaxID=3154303 RepID=UPI0033BB8213
MVRALVAGVGDFPVVYVGEAGTAGGKSAFQPLGSVAPATRELATALHRNGVDTGGDPLLECTKAALLERWRTLLDDGQDDDGDAGEDTGGGDEPLIVHFAGHGVPAAGSLFLVTSGAVAHTKKLAGTCVSFGQLLLEAQLSGRPVLFMLDVCHAGQAIVQQEFAEWAERRDQEDPGDVWIVAAAAAGRSAYGAAFTTATAEVLQQLADGEIDLDESTAYLSVDALATLVDEHLNLADSAAGWTGLRTVMHTSRPGAAPQEQPFLPNPAYRGGSAHGSLTADVRLPLREFVLACTPGLDPLHFASRAAGDRNPNAVFFSGRRSQLERIGAWIDGQDADADGGGGGGADASTILAVTGGPGSGKSAILGVVACLLHPDLAPRFAQRVANAVDPFEPRRPETVLAVHARQLTLQQITDALHEQLLRQVPDLHSRRAATDRAATDRAATDRAGTDTSLAHLLDDLRDAGDVLVVLDALDEAADPAAVADQLLIPLTRATDGDRGSESRARAIVGTRPWWDTFPTLNRHLDARPGSRLDLDLDPADEAARDQLIDDIASYLRKLLPPYHPARSGTRAIAEELVRHNRDGVFLAASLFGHHLLDKPQRMEAGPPRSLTEIFELHMDLLSEAEPWVRPVLTVLGRARGQGMPLDLIHAAALAHRPPRPGEPTRTLSDTRRVLTKAAFYLRATPDTDHRLCYRYFHQALVDHTLDLTDPGTLHQALVSTVPTHPDGTPDWSRGRPYLQRHAAFHAVRDGADALDRLLADPQYMLWADPDGLAPFLHLARDEQARRHADIYRTSTAHDPRRNLLEARRDLLALDALAWRKPDIARAVQTAGGHRPGSRTLVWATRLTHPARRHTLRGHRGEVRVVATATDKDGTPLAVTGDWNHTVIVWDLTTGTARHTLTGRNGFASTVVITADRDGTPLDVIFGKENGAIVWDLTSGTMRHTLISGGEIDSLMVAADSDGTPLLIGAGDHHRMVYAWDLITGTEHFKVFCGRDAGSPVVLTTHVDGTPLAVVGMNNGEVIVWDLRAGAPRWTLTGHTDRVTRAAVATDTDGTPLAVTQSFDGRVIVWNLTTCTLRYTFTDPARVGSAMVFTADPDGVPLGVSLSGEDRVGDRGSLVIVWDLTTGTPRHTLTGHTAWVQSLLVTADAEGAPLALTTAKDGRAIVWDLTAGAARQILTGHTKEVRMAAIAADTDGSPLAVTVSEDRTAIVWDLTPGTSRQPFSGHTSQVNAAAIAVDTDGSPLAVTVGDDRTVIVWDLATGAARHTLTGHTQRILSVTATADTDGTPLAITCGWDRVVHVWDLSTGTLRSTFTGHRGSVFIATVLTDAEGPPVVVTGSKDHRMIMWDPHTGSTLRDTYVQGHITPSAAAVLKRADGKLLGISGGGESNAYVWDLNTGNRLHDLNGHTAQVTAVAAITGADGAPLAVIVSDDRTAVWDLDSGTVRHSLPGGATVMSMALTTDGDGIPLAVLGTDNRGILVWDLVTGIVRRTLTGHPDWVRAVAVTTDVDGSPLVVAGSGSSALSDRGMLIAWNPDTGAEVFRYHLPNAVTCIAADGPGFVVGHGPDVAHFAPPGWIRKRRPRGPGPCGAAPAASR